MSPAGRRPAGARGARRTDPARRVAFDALRAVHAHDAYANLVLADLLHARHLSSRDAAFATELLAGTCRAQGTYDAILVAASGRELRTLQPAVVDVLRLGVHQLLAMRVPSHAAVTASVDLAASAVGERVTGVVNAVLRKVAAADLDGWVERLTAGLDPLAAQALRTAHPAWVCAAIGDLLGNEAEEALRADNLAPQTTLVARPGLASVAELVAAGATPGRWSPYAATWASAPGELAAVREGRAGVQDEGSQLVTLALARAAGAGTTRGDQPGGWLDLCAGPGGKAALLAGLAAEREEWVLASEISVHRARLVAQALARYPSAWTVVADGLRPPWRPASFARVLADVPCTGLGALRRRPESRWRRGPESVEQLHPLQVGLLSSALEAAAPGGVVAYVTCSPHRRETVDVVSDVLAHVSDRGDDIEVLDATALLSEVPDAAVEASWGRAVQLWPHRHGTDAMFLALLRKG
ncbi:MAG: RsmB/NOP family class I SAM-dependent RNA methyltransferase [Propionibacteriaceae bacterium]